ncbi:hypothetical protein SAMN04489730_7000 [Amycolatopsis australiensis]|uniref:Uncharacterized protein n=1 Tax=Amycolatopsis australiensis TaxID=546364 RepID=A0A1K1SW54_9PSEU|nr:hypothetical protein SAMN04489730_7000 [Amycolatopsis australiensis]
MPAESGAAAADGGVLVGRGSRAMPGASPNRCRPGCRRRGGHWRTPTGERSPGRPRPAGLASGWREVERIVAGNPGPRSRRGPADMCRITVTSRDRIVEVVGVLELDRADGPSDTSSGLLTEHRRVRRLGGENQLCHTQTRNDERNADRRGCSSRWIPGRCLGSIRSAPTACSPVRRGAGVLDRITRGEAARELALRRSRRPSRTWSACGGFTRARVGGIPARRPARRPRGHRSGPRWPAAR